MSHIAKKSLHKESKMESSTKPLSSAISEISTVKGTPKAIRDWLMSSAADSRAKTSVAPEKERGSPESGPGYGLKWKQPFASYDHDSCSLKTAQCSLFEDSNTSSVHFPKWGILRDGVLYRLPMSERPTFEKGYGYWRTPTATEADHGGPNARDSNGGLHLSAQVMRWPTPTSSMMTTGDLVQSKFAGNSKNRPSYQEAKKQFHTLASRDCRHPNKKSYKERGVGKKGEQLPNVIGGSLNPDWLEWLMGWPIEWTALKPLEMAKFRLWLQQHGKFYQENKR